MWLEVNWEKLVFQSSPAHNVGGNKLVNSTTQTCKRSTP